jgi:hypothetical protein
VLRDRVGHESEAVDCECYLIEPEPPNATGGGKLTGEINPKRDVDACAVDMAKGDILIVKVKAKSVAKGKSFVPAVDLVAPDAERLVEGRYPEDAKKVSIVGWVAQATGRYLVVLRRDKTSDTDRGTHGLMIKVKQAKENKKGKGTTTGQDIVFEAGEGCTLKALVKGDGLTSADITLTGPEGPVAFEVKEKKGKVKVLPTVLDQGTGTYRISVAKPIEISWKWLLKLPKKLKGMIKN